MILVGALRDIPAGEAVRVEADVPVAVFRVESDEPGESGVYAVDDTCPHQQASLSEGWVEGCAVECPLHAALFDLRTGEPDGTVTDAAVRTHQVVVVDGMVYLRPAGWSAGQRPDSEVA